ncbi:hypothetical protein [Methylobacterium sp. Leaf102]|uniref:hypothetical protein n=1 Tax=Methylobacterium sp. Leaf102 TaxID=1736253 RepID=UPI000A7845E2|nr:hypothetical protein [Methylobacterium sp. Leaf102]
MIRTHIRLLVLFVAAPVLASCGLAVPNMQEPYESEIDGRRYSEKDFENLIINNIKCELHYGVQNTLAFFKNENNIQWIKSWGAVVNLKITVDEQSTLGPSVGLTPIFSPFSLTAAATGSAHTTRAETIAFSYSFKDLLSEGPITPPCDHEKGILIQSDLKIAEFIFNKAWIATVPGSVSEESLKHSKLPISSPYSVFSEELTFVATYSSRISPMWTFTRVNFDKGGDFFSASRTKTHDLTITLGPTKPASKSKPAEVSNIVAEYNFAKIIGQEVASAIRRTTQ